jgi:hypothetical protein
LNKIRKVLTGEEQLSEVETNDIFREYIEVAFIQILEIILKLKLFGRPLLNSLYEVYNGFHVSLLVWVYNQIHVIKERYFG